LDRRIKEDQQDQSFVKPSILANNPILGQADGVKAKQQQLKKDLANYYKK